MAMGLGGAYEFEFGRVKYTQAFHSSSFTTADGEIIYAGMPGGIFFTEEENNLSCRRYGIFWGYETNWRTKCD